MNRNPNPVLLAAILLFFLLSCNTSPETGKNNAGDSVTAPVADSVKPTGTPPEHATGSVTISTFNTSEGWGYDIYNNGKLYIHQTSIPAVSGNRGFETEEAAKKAGDFVAYKIQNNIMPPTVSVEELDSLGVHKK